MSQGPTVKKAMRKLRLRGEDFPLECAADIQGGGTVRATLLPDQWVEVPDAIYQQLKQQFAVEEERLVPDFEANEARPHKRGEAPAMRRELKPGYIIEGFDRD